MGRHTCCYKQKLRKGLWSPEEDEKLLQHITKYGHGCWSSVPKLAGLQRCGKSCRLRWINYLRPDLKRGAFSQQEEDLIIQLHAELGNRWSKIAAQLPGRTDNEIKNLWNSSIKKKLRERGIDPNTHKPLSEAEAGCEKSGTPSSSPDQARPVDRSAESSGSKNSVGFFSLNYGSDNRTSPVGLHEEASSSFPSWFNHNGKVFDTGPGFDCGSISSVLPPVSGSILSTSTGLKSMAGLMQESSHTTCVGGGLSGVQYWESGTSSNSSGTTGNIIELQASTPFLNNTIFPWREFPINKESDQFHLEGELEELKWSEFLQSAATAPFPTLLPILHSPSQSQSQSQNILCDPRAMTQFAFDDIANWQQTHGPPPQPSLAPIHQQQQQNQLAQLQNSDMCSKDFQRISAAFGQL